MARRLLRLVVPSPDRRRVLARPNGLAGWILPVVPVDDATAWTGDADLAAHRLLGSDTVPVRRLDLRTWELEARGRIPAVGATWIAPDEAARVGADADAVTTWARVEEARADGSHTGSPHLQPGWRDDIEAWLAETLPDLPTGNGDAAGDERITVLRHWELAAVLAVPTTSGPVVVKEGGAGFTREAAVTSVLDGLPAAPALVVAEGPRVVTRWAGPSGAAPDHAVAAALGALQRGAASRVSDLRAVGCPDASALAASVDHAVAGALEQLDAIGLADSVVHGDAHGANAVGTDDVVLVDWSDASVGCPAIDLDLVLGHDGGEVTPILEAWCAGFGCDADPVARALPAVRIVAAALAVALHRQRRAGLPDSVLPLWDGWAADWETRLEQLLS